MAKTKLNLKTEAKPAPETKEIPDDGEVKVTTSPKIGDQSKPGDTVEQQNAQVPAPKDGVLGTGNGDCEPECRFAFVSVVPGSTVYVGRDVKVNGCTTSGFLTFSPVGEPMVNPIKRNELMYPFGVLLISDEEIAKKLIDTSRCVSTPYHLYNAENDGELSCYVEVEQVTPEQAGCPTC